MTTETRDARGTGTASVAVGDAAITALEELAAFVDRHSTAFCTSSSWLLAAGRHLPGAPVVITVDRGGRTVGVAALSLTTRRGTRRVELLGGELNDYGRFFYDDEAAADLLADAVAGWVLGLRRWSVDLEQLAADDAVMAGLLTRLDGRLEDGPEMRSIVGIGTDYKASKNRIRKGTVARKRLEEDDRSWELVAITDATTLDRWLTAVVDLRRDRDHGLGRRSHLDDDANRAFYEATVRGAVANGRGIVDLLIVDEVLAGYGVVMVDGDVHRLADGRVSEDFQQYWAGTLCDLTAVLRAQQDETVTCFDWLRGVADGKYGNVDTHRHHLRAASHRWIATVDDLEQATRQRVKASLPRAAVQRLISR
ncbi:GNAT family N-acetyltransferase [Nocardioides stalactiti]|uniref:GNAT family N-acetyltransferase n=1 Tax=Nocardioides stalactiti TaxID=2755356 RepID=UPI0016012B1D|nr:GNAT family N-acetyltransferase [Nocardioides stalactiti]